MCFVLFFHWLAHVGTLILAAKLAFEIIGNVTLRSLENSESNLLPKQ